MADELASCARRQHRRPRRAPARTPVAASTAAGARARRAARSRSCSGSRPVLELARGAPCDRRAAHRAAAAPPTPRAPRRARTSCPCPPGPTTTATCPPSPAEPPRPSPLCSPDSVGRAAIAPLDDRGGSATPGAASRHAPRRRRCSCSSARSSGVEYARSVAHGRERPAVLGSAPARARRSGVSATARDEARKWSASASMSATVDIGAGRQPVAQAPG